jgi:hypothetical protein
MSEEEGLSLIVVKKFSMRSNLMFFSYEIYTTRFIWDYFLSDIL